MVGFDINIEGLNETAQACADQFVGLQGNVSSEKCTDRLVAATMERFDRIDKLFNNAGINILDLLPSGAVPEMDVFADVQ